ncbi:ATP-citrate synthase alpha chain protein 1 [Senna tora]|uniref:ATP-citrate synthase alpha chain protein 1 n=1 Tax=Senna tora TaxID=362788 RepID=A0A834WSE3_9FABA|nr:ATP-citrate synthase alpha chain protein 1 [Senna tora]
MNPFSLVNEKPCPLDMRGELDGTAAFMNFKKWGNIEFPMPFGRVMNPTECLIHGLDERVTWGGASVIYADTVGDLGYASELGNYAEYSGAPNEEQVLHLKGEGKHSGIIIELSSIVEELTQNVYGICKQAIQCITAAA